MSPPRVAHVINSIGLGGVPESVFHLLRTMPPGGCEPSLYVLRGPDPADEHRAARLARFRQIGLPVTLGAPDEGRLSIVAQLHDWLAREAPDILHSHSYKPNLHAGLAAGPLRSGGLKVIAHYHNQYDAQWQRDGTLGLDAALAARCDRVVACSGAVADHVRERLGVRPERLAVIPNGVDDARFSTPLPQTAARAEMGLPAGRPIIGLVGRISEQKGQEDLLRAAAAVRAAVPDVLFVFAGAPDTPERIVALQELVSSLGLRDAVHFAGFVADIPTLYGALDVLAAPSRWEGFGLMLVEAMTAGVPIVATAVGAIPEIVGNEGAARLVPPGDAVALSAALIDVLSHPDQARCLAEAGRRRARSFTWDHSAARLSQLYATLSDRGPAP
jgi:glycosyltransferase involved in cell wall biosynthesis